MRFTTNFWRKDCSRLQSDQDNLKVVATIEEINIMDLEKELAAMQTEVIRTVYQDGTAGRSRKQLRSYFSDLMDQGIQYDPRYLDRGEFGKFGRVI
jgi:hypothetical protein